MTRVVIDTGPLVALLNRRDGRHEWVRQVLGDIEPPLFTCEAVLAEACFLLSAVRGGQDALLEVVRRDVVRPDFEMAGDVEALQALMRKFASVPMSLADACLVRMTELNPDSVVLTLDSNFRIYRRNQRQVVPTIFPPTKGKGRQA